MNGFLSQPTVPYVAPMVAFAVLLVAAPHLALGAWEYPSRVGLLALVLFVFSRRVIELRPRQWLTSIAVGTGVFFVWIAPDVLWPGYRESWLFQNGIMGTVESSVAVEHRQTPMVWIFRAIRSAILVPIIEELFWRGWMMRWLIDANFTRVALGAFTPLAFFVTALLFASEHGAFWDVGLAAGIAYNWWMVRTRSLADCILAHSVTNGLLSGYVLIEGKWQYW